MIKFLKNILSKSFYKNFMVLLSGNAVSQLIPFLLAPFVARLYGPEDFAVQTNFLVLAGLFAVVATGRYELAIILPKDEKKGMTLFNLSVIIMIAVTMLSFILYFFRGQIAVLYKAEKLSEYVIYVPLAIVGLAGYNILYNWLVRHREFKNISLSKIAQSLFGNLAYVVLGYLIAGVTGLIIGWLIGQLISLFILLYKTYSYRQGLLKFNKAEMKSTAREYKNFPMINSLHAFTDFFAGQFLLIGIITREYGLITLGLFSVSYRYLIAPIQLVAGAVSQVYYRDATEKINMEQRAIPVFHQTLKICLLFAVPMTVVIMIWGEKLFTLYLGPQWTEAGKYARILMPALFFNFLASPLSATPLIFKKQRNAFLITLIGYTVCLGSLIVSSWMKISFAYALGIYTCLMAAYYLFLLFWYRHLLIKN
ncbi:MAG TPA: oligosaccharide flippase family protein [Bacteroidales bacterium]|nr:oligosaccharide flippase family protein [Bacteroidales bacterium]